LPRSVASPVLEGFFGSDVASVEVDLYRDAIGELTDGESLALPRAHPDRLLEYRAGRHCAREALARFGVRGVSILRNEDRSPVWPAGFVGSITHSRSHGRGWCAAAVIRTSAALGIGIDAELDAPLERKLWDRVLLAPEQEWLEGRSESERGFLGKLIFSAKEATYKCQYAVTKAFLEFADVRVTLALESGSFRAELTRAVPPFDAGFAFDGRYARKNGLVATGVLLARR
jgi:4'-phosphopantetheinyl transferase EntD